MREGAQRPLGSAWLVLGENDYRRVLADEEFRSALSALLVVARIYFVARPRREVVQ